MAHHVGAVAVEAVGARLGAHRDDGLAAAVLGAEVVGDDAHFLQTLGVRHDRRFVVAAAHDRQAVELNVVGERAAAVDADRRPLAAAVDADAERVRVVGALRQDARDRAGLQDRVRERVLRDVRQRLDHLGAHRAGDARAIRLQERRLGGDFDGLTELAHRQFDGHTDGFRRADDDAGALELREAGERHRNRVGACLKIGRGEQPFRVGDDFARHVRVLVGDDHGGAGHGRLLRVGDRSGDGRGPNLRVRDGGAQEARQDEHRTEPLLQHN